MRDLASDNPYQHDWIPLLSDYRRQVVQHRVSVAREARNNERRKIEPLYLVDRDKLPLLSDEEIDHNREPRDAEGLTWAAERLAVLGFTREEHDRVIVYSRELDGLELCADPRRTKASLFRAYAPKPPEPAKKRRGPKPRALGHITFSLPDSAKNDLPGQFLKALRLAIAKRAHYDKRYPGAPWQTITNAME